MPGPDLATLAELPQGPDIASTQDHLVQAVKAACPLQVHTRAVTPCIFVLGSDWEPYFINARASIVQHAYTKE